MVFQLQLPTSFQIKDVINTQTHHALIFLHSFSLPSLVLLRKSSLFSVISTFKNVFYNLHKLLLIFHNVNHLLLCHYFQSTFLNKREMWCEEQILLTQFLLRSQRDFSRLRLAIPELQYRIPKFHSPARQGLVKKRLSSSCIYSFHPSCLLDMIEKTHSTVRYLQITFSSQIPIL